MSVPPQPPRAPSPAPATPPPLPGGGPDPPPWRRAGQVGSIGLEMVTAVVVAGSAGAWADRQWPIQPWGTLAGLAIGAAAAGRSVARLVRGVGRGP